MPRIRIDAGAKWQRRTATATQEYSEGVENPRVPWAASTIAAAANQAAGVQAAIAEKRFEKGVAKAGDSKWKAKATTKGARNFAPGVQDAQPDYETGFAPYAAVINAVTLPPRFPTGDPRNIARVTAIAAALRTKKLGK